jgi:hypothetical protein
LPLRVAAAQVSPCCQCLSQAIPAPIPFTGSKKKKNCFALNTFSMNAKNIKIIVRDGKVMLRGPLDTA